MEMCDQKNNITMCPLCDKTCSYWKLSSACATARASHLFDNPATVFFSIFMALWGKGTLQHGSHGQDTGSVLSLLSSVSGHPQGGCPHLGWRWRSARVAQGLGLCCPTWLRAPGKPGGRFVLGNSRPSCPSRMGSCFKTG
jgi:hypothetical protein